MFPQLYNYPYNSLQLCVPSAMCSCGSLFSLTKTRLSQRTCAVAPTSDRFWHLNVTLLPETYYSGEGTVENGQEAKPVQKPGFSYKKTTNRLIWCCMHALTLMATSRGPDKIDLMLYACTDTDGYVPRTRQDWSDVVCMHWHWWLRPADQTRLIWCCMHALTLMATSRGPDKIDLMLYACTDTDGYVPRTRQDWSDVVCMHWHWWLRPADQTRLIWCCMHALTLMATSRGPDKIDLMLYACTDTDGYVPRTRQDWSDVVCMHWHWWLRPADQTRLIWCCMHALTLMATSRGPDTIDLMLYACTDTDGYVSRTRQDWSDVVCMHWHWWLRPADQTRLIWCCMHALTLMATSRGPDKTDRDSVCKVRPTPTGTVHSMRCQVN